METKPNPKQNLFNTILGFIIIGFAVYYFYPRGNKSAGNNAELQKALNEFKSGQLMQCEKRLRDYTFKYSNDFQGWSFLGTVYLEQEKDSLAEIAFKKALKLNGKEVKAMTGLGVVLKNRKDYERAEYYYKSAIEEDPTYGKAYSSLLMIRLIEGKFHEAVLLGEKAVGLDQTDLGIRGNLSVAYHYFGNFSKRDSMVKLLEQRGYADLKYLKMLFNDPELAQKLLNE